MIEDFCDDLLLYIIDFFKNTIHIVKLKKLSRRLNRIIITKPLFMHAKFDKVYLLKDIFQKKVAWKNNKMLCPQLLKTQNFTFQIGCDKNPLFIRDCIPKNYKPNYYHSLQILLQYSTNLKLLKIFADNINAAANYQFHVPSTPEIFCNSNSLAHVFTSKNTITENLYLPPIIHHHKINHHKHELLKACFIMSVHVSDYDYISKESDKDLPLLLKKPCVYFYVDEAVVCNYFPK